MVAMTTSGATRELSNMAEDGSTDARRHDVIISPKDGPVGGRWRRLPVDPIVRLYVGLLATGVAFAAALASLANGFRFASTTGELVVVPLVVAVLLHLTIRRHDGLWNGRLGHGDYVGAAMVLVGAAGILWWQPEVQLNDGVVKRLDLLALPVVLAAVLVLMFGLRILHAALFPIGYAFLAWPYPWTLIETSTIARLADGTYLVAAWIAEQVGVAQSLPDAGDNVLRIGTGEQAFEISVAPACSGFTGIVAYVLMGGAALFLSRGSVTRRATWLVTGLLLTWVATVLRVVLLAVVGNTWGSWAALQALHPVAGLALDTLDRKSVV